MARKRSPDKPPCPRRGATAVKRNGSKGGKLRRVCPECRRSFGPTFGTAMYRLRTSSAEVVRTLLIVMRRGNLSAAAEITGHKVEAVGRRLRAAARQAEAITEALAHDLHLTEVRGGCFPVHCQEKGSCPIG